MNWASVKELKIHNLQVGSLVCGLVKPDLLHDIME